MYILDYSKLRFGDVLLTRTNDRTCLKIREFSNSNYSHTLIYLGNMSCLESNAFGVQSVNIQRLIFENNDDVKVLRLKSIELINKLVIGVNNARLKIGMGYASRHELMKSYLNVLTSASEGNRQFCTRFIAQIYSESGISIVENPDYCSPKNIEESGEFEEIDNILRTASEPEKELALNEDNPINTQTEATFNFLEEARVISGQDIQTFEDVDKYILANKNNTKLCALINEKLKESGYLDLGDFEKESNPNMYDYDLFINAFGEDNCYNISLLEYDNELNRIMSYIYAEMRYEDLYDETRCSYFESHMKCYERQLEICNERLVLFKRTLGID